MSKDLTQEDRYPCVCGHAKIYHVRAFSEYPHIQRTRCCSGMEEGAFVSCNCWSYKPMDNLEYVTWVQERRRNV